MSARTVVVLNTRRDVNDRTMYRVHTYLFSFGAYGSTVCLVHGTSWEDAFETCADWIAENAPGLMCDKEVEEAYHAALDGHEPDEAREDGQWWGEYAQDVAQQDTMYADPGHYFNVSEVAGNEVTRDRLIAMRAAGVAFVPGVRS